MAKKKNIYADFFGPWPWGYMEYYEEHWEETLMPYIREHRSLEEKLRRLAYDQRWHFANRIAKTHEYCIPAVIMSMRIKHFIKEIVDGVLSKGQPRQLELVFPE